MKQVLSTGLVMLGLARVCAADQASFTTNVNQVIPDGGAALRTLSSSLVVSGILGPISDISVDLNVSGGFNGDLFGYLRGPDGNITVLVNRVGQTTLNLGGYENTGLALRFSDSAANDIHAYQDYQPSYNAMGQVTGVWQPDGRNTDPATVSVGDARDSLLSSFIGSAPNGTWTLVLSDWMTSGSPSMLQSWSLQITAVPEPTTVACGLGALTVLAVVRWRKGGRA